MPLAENTVRDIASRYGGGDAPEQRAAEESPALRHAGAAIEAVLRGDPAAFLEAIQLMMDPVAP
ncbi:MAG TPA: hypothetical protein VI384_04265, partial [Candidatus Dormibacteraeota bacterium]